MHQLALHLLETRDALIRSPSFKDISLEDISLKDIFERNSLKKDIFNSNLPAAKTAKQLVIPVVRKDLWKKRIASNVDFIKSEHEKSNNEEPKKVKSAISYYQKILPKIYGVGNLSGWLKSIATHVKGRKEVVFREKVQNLFEHEKNRLKLTFL